MISVCNSAANWAAKGVFPEAVGPSIAIKSYLDILNNYFRLHNSQKQL